MKLEMERVGTQKMTMKLINLKDSFPDQGLIVLNVIINGVNLHYTKLIIVRISKINNSIF